MTPRFSARILLANEDATVALARTLSSALGPGDTVLLSGGIGGGKTALCRALIQHRMALAGSVEDVPSPTFTLVQTYDLPGGEIWHADLYRVSDPWEVIELGLDQAMTDALCLIEWPDRLGDLTPKTALSIELEVGTTEDQRIATISASDARWSGLIERLDQKRQVSA